ncbi:MAG: hypothetical protein QM736_07120 [Vicinamibacterales bacterium]
MRRAELWLLHHEFDVRVCGQRTTNFVALVSGDHSDGRRVKCRGGCEHVLDHRHSRHVVEHLRRPGFHPGALSGSENDDVNVRHDVHDYRPDSS